MFAVVFVRSEESEDLSGDDRWRDCAGGGLLDLCFFKTSEASLRSDAKPLSIVNTRHHPSLSLSLLNTTHTRAYSDTPPPKKDDWCTMNAARRGNKSHTFITLYVGVMSFAHTYHVVCVCNEFCTHPPSDEYIEREEIYETGS